MNGDARQIGVIIAAVALVNYAKVYRNSTGTLVIATDYEIDFVMAHMKRKFSAL